MTRADRMTVRLARRAPRVLLPPKPGERFVGKHSLVLEGGWTEEGEALRFVNSWGREWGDHGYGLIGREYFDQHVDEAWLSRRADVGPSPAMLTRLEEGVTLEEAWMTDNPHFDHPWEHRDRLYSKRSVTVFSLDTGRSVDVTVIRSLINVPLAWSHLYHHDDTGSLRELFVWPGARRRGLGRRLDEEATRRLEEAGVREQLIRIHQADALPRLLPTLRAFLSARGYELAEVAERLPNVTMLGSKQVRGGQDG
jgi:GNAT superfamily N-acetyltransferase